MASQISTLNRHVKNINTYGKNKPFTLKKCNMRCNTHDRTECNVIDTLDLKFCIDSDPLNSITLLEYSMQMN